MKEIQNAKIISTMLGKEDHGIFTCYLTLEGDGWGCGFGGYRLDNYDTEKKCCVGTAKGMEAIICLMETLEIGKWEDLKGIYVRCETDGWGGKITKIGHLIKDRWFSFEEFFRKEREAAHNATE